MDNRPRRPQRRREQHLAVDWQVQPSGPQHIVNVASTSYPQTSFADFSNSFEDTSAADSSPSWDKSRTFRDSQFADTTSNLPWGQSNDNISMNNNSDTRSVVSRKNIYPPQIPQPVSTQWPEPEEKEREWIDSQRRGRQQPKLVPPTGRPYVKPLSTLGERKLFDQKCQSSARVDMTADDFFRTNVFHSAAPKVEKEIKGNEAASFGRFGVDTRELDVIRDFIRMAMPHPLVVAEAIYRSGLDILDGCGPSSSALLCALIEKKETLCDSLFIAIERCHDFMPTIKVMAADRWNWKEELGKVSSHFKQLKKKLRDEKMELVVPGHKFKLLISCGGVSEFLDPSDCCSLVMNLEHSEVICSSPGYLSHRLLSKQEVEMCSRYFNTVKGKWEVCSTTYNVMVSFASVASTNRCKEEQKEKGVLVEHCPPFLFLGSCSPKEERKMVLELRWLKKPPGKKAWITISNADQVLQAVEVFTFNQFGSEANREIGNRRIRVIDIPTWIATTEDLELWAGQILNANSIEFESATLDMPFKSQIIAGTHAQDEICEVISEKLVTAAIAKDVWSTDIGERPKRADELAEYVVDYKRFPWTIKLKSTEGMEHIAEVHFLDYSNGCRIVEGLMEELNIQRMSLNKHDRRGVKPCPKVSVGWSVPMEVRRVCYDDINELKERLINGSCDEENATIDCVSQGLSNVTLSITGFPKEHVEKAFKELQSIVEPSTYPCDTEGEKWLLFGIGASYLRSICDRFSTEDGVVVDVDTTRKTLTIYGGKKARELFIKEVEFAVNNRDGLWIETNLHIGPPRYLNQMEVVMDAIHDGCKNIELAIGINAEQMIYDRDTKSVSFRGTVKQYDNLLTLLEQIDATILEYVPDCSLTPSRPSCTVCLDVVSDNFYCLELCGHYYCMDCICRQIDAQILTREFPIACALCNDKMAVSDVKRIILGGPNRLPWLDSIKLQPFIRSSIDYLLSQKGTKYSACLTPDCEGIFQRCVPPPGLTPIYTCESCKRRMCMGCALDEHTQTTCEQNIFIRANADASLRKYIEEAGHSKVRKCPREGCAAVIEKDAGCNHIHCVKCKTHFCWICQHQTETEGQMYKHLADKHGGADGGWRFEDGVLVGVPEGDEDALIQQMMQPLLGFAPVPAELRQEIMQLLERRG